MMLAFHKPRGTVGQAEPWSQSGQGSLERQKGEEPGSECVCSGQERGGRGESPLCLLGRGRVGFLLLYFLAG